MTGQTPERIGARTTLQKLLSRFHFGITLFAVALSGLTILLAGVSALRGYADRNMELAAQLGAYGVEPALVFNDPQAAREGLIETLVEAGAFISSPSCDYCYGRIATMSDGQRAVSTGTLNTPGRMGSVDSEIYICNAAVVAASAIEGRISDPRPYLAGGAV